MDHIYTELIIYDIYIYIWHSYICLFSWWLYYCDYLRPHRLCLSVADFRNTVFSVSLNVA